MMLFVNFDYSIVSFIFTLVFYMSWVFFRLFIPLVSCLLFLCFGALDGLGTVSLTPPPPHWWTIGHYSFTCRISWG